MTLINDLTTLVQALLQVTPPTVGANAEAAEKNENMKTKSRKMRKRKRWRWGWRRPAKTLRRVQLNSPNGLAYHLFTHMLYVPMLWTPARYRLQNIENCVLTVVRRFE